MLKPLGRRPISLRGVAGDPQVLVRFEAQQRRQRRRLQQPQLDLAEALHEEQRQAMAECLHLALAGAVFNCL